MIQTRSPGSRYKNDLPRPVNSKLFKWLVSAAKLACCGWLLCILTVIGAAQTTNQSKTIDEAKKNQDELKSLRQELSRLKDQNQQLRLENQKLRRLLADQGEAIPAIPPAAKQQPGTASPSAVASKTNAVDAGSGQAQTFWLSKTTGKRHNSRCKYYNKSDGRFCGPNDGVPCKLCGG